jgi:hypothetical protein
MAPKQALSTELLNIVPSRISSMTPAYISLTQTMDACISKYQGLSV